MLSLRPRSSTFAALGALLTASCATDAEPGVVERPRNVILFVVDTLRADRLTPYGYEREITPNTQALADRGVVWENNRSQGPWTAPSMVSLMTGLYVTDEEQVLPPTHPTLAELVQEAGYATGAFVGNLILTTERGFERGFDHFEMIRGDDAQLLVDGFGDWLDGVELPDGGPGFFAWIHPIDPHHPYRERPGFELLATDRPDQQEIERRWLRELPRVDELSPGVGWTYERARFYMLAQNARYDSEVFAVDRALGELVRDLERRGELEHTTILFAADHGEMMYEYPHYPLELDARLEREGGLRQGLVGLMAVGHRAWFYPELWNTPLIAAGPGFPSGERRTGLSGNIDLFPTVLSLLGVEHDEQRPGIDLTGGVDPPRERIFAHGFATTAVLEDGGLQLIEHERRRFLLPDDAPRPIELFDLDRGPELLDLETERPADAERLEQEIGAWRATHQRAVTTSELGEAALEALRELGYIDDDEPPLPGVVPEAVPPDGPDPGGDR